MALNILEKISPPTRSIVYTSDNNRGPIAGWKGAPRRRKGGTFSRPEQVACAFCPSSIGFHFLDIFQVPRRPDKQPHRPLAVAYFPKAQSHNRHRNADPYIRK